MHSSRMRTAHFNGHLWEGVSAKGVCVQGVCVQAGGCVHPHTQRQTPPCPIACCDTSP